jgi:HD-GYP domain-containing protein (c-di-GMP phosphodiesterase class II)
MLRTRPRRLIIKRPSPAPTTASGSAQPLVQPIRESNNFKSDIIKVRLDLLEKICSSTGSLRHKTPIITNFNEMVRYALNASASSVIILSPDRKDLNQFTDGPLGTEVKQWPVSERHDIVRWISENKKPSIINNIDKDNGVNLLLKDEVNGLESRTVAFAPLVINSHLIGVVKALNKLDGNDFNEHDLQILKGVAGNIVLTLENIHTNETMLYSLKDNIQKLVSLLDPKENAAGRHAIRVAEFALMGATELALSDEVKHNLAYAGILHDIGLLSIPDNIINKTTALTREEQYIIRKHSVIGYNLIQGIPTLSEVSKLILYHHERFDGKGYPCGLKGNMIPMGARLLAVADAFASMTEKHFYRAAIFAKDALDELNKFVGSQFCPVAAKAFIMGYIKSRGLKATLKKANST